MAIEIDEQRSQGFHIYVKGWVNHARGIRPEPPPAPSPDAGFRHYEDRQPTGFCHTSVIEILAENGEEINFGEVNDDIEKGFKKAGYNEVVENEKEIHDGDVVIYGIWPQTRAPQDGRSFAHVGIVKEKDVLSEFGKEGTPYMTVYAHEIDVVAFPQKIVNQVRVFRKRK